jgi:AsmA protein
LPKSDAKKQPEQPLDLSALKGLNANGSIRVGSLKVANVKASSVRIDIKAANGAST